MFFSKITKNVFLNFTINITKSIDEPSYEYN